MVYEAEQKVHEEQEVVEEALIDLICPPVEAEQIVEEQVKSDMPADLAVEEPEVLKQDLNLTEEAVEQPEDVQIVEDRYMVEVEAEVSEVVQIIEPQPTPEPEIEE